MASRKLPLPDHLDVLGVPFRVEMLGSLEDVAEDEEQTWGDTVGFNRRIRINSSQDTRRQWTTLMHEMMHAALYVTGVSGQITDEIEEIIVQSLEHAMEQFLLKHGDQIVKSLEVQK